MKQAKRVRSDGLSAGKYVGYAVCAVVMVAVLIMGAVVTTLGVMASRQDSAEDQPTSLTTIIKRQTLQRTVTGSLEAVPRSKVVVQAQGTVTRTGIQPGEDVGEGEAIAYVDERPVLVVQGMVPVYRTLAPGSVGEDVAQIQGALARLGYAVYDELGRYGDSTALALAQYLQYLGFPAVDAAGAALKADDWKQTALPKGQVVFARELPVRAQDTCGQVGQQLDGEMCVLESAQRSYAAKFLAADLPDPESVQGRTVAIRTEPEHNAVLESVLHPPAEERTTTETDPDVGQSAQPKQAPDETEGKYVRLALEGINPQELPVDANDIAVSLVLASSADNAYVIESVALNDDGSAYWLDDKDGRRIDVTPGFCDQGLCEISGTGLAEGMEVRIPSSVVAHG